MKAIINYLVYIFLFIVRRIVSVVLISTSLVCFSLAMGTGGPSIFLINFGIHIMLFIVGIFCGVIGTLIWVPHVKISLSEILSIFRLSSN